MIFNNKRILLALGLMMGMGMPTVSLICAQEAVPVVSAEAPMHTDKDEKEMHALGQTLAEIVGQDDTAAFIRDIPKEIPFIIPEHRHIKKAGKPTAEFLDSTADEIHLFVSFKEIIETALSKKEMPVIARVVTQMSEGNDAVRYFDVESLSNYFKASRVYFDPTNKTPIKELSYCVYVPELACFEVACIIPPPAGLLPVTHVPPLLSVAQIQEYALFATSQVLFDVKTPQYHKKARAIATHVYEHATHNPVKQKAQLSLALCLRDGQGGDKDIAKARALLEALTRDANGVVCDVAARASEWLAHGFYQGIDPKLWPKDNSRALQYALQVIKNPYHHEFSLSQRAYMYRVAGELLIQHPEHAQAPDAFGYLEKALRGAQELNQPLIQARIHACLALCYYNEPRFGTGTYTDEDEEGRYKKAWHHCTRALEQYAAVAPIPGFLELVAEMHYFALGNEGDIKKALKYMQSIGYPSDRVRCMMYHREYYHTEPAKKKAAREKLQEFIVGYHDKKDPFYFTVCALLGQMYVYEAEDAWKQAKLYMETDSEYAESCSKLATDLDGRAKRIFEDILTIQGYESSYAWALAHLMMGYRELYTPACDYAKAENYFEMIHEKTDEFSMLASDAQIALDDLARNRKNRGLDYQYKERLAPTINPRHPRYYEIVFRDARLALNTLALFDQDNPFGDIQQNLRLVIEKEPKGSVWKMQAEHALPIVKKYEELIGTLRAACERDDKAAADAILMQLTELPNKAIRAEAEQYLRERAGIAMPDDYEPDDQDDPAEVYRAVVLPVAAGMDLGTDEPPRGKKRKAESQLHDPRALRPQDSNGSGSAGRN